MNAKKEDNFATDNENSQAIALQNNIAAKSELDDVPPEVLKNLTNRDDLVAEERIKAVLHANPGYQSVDKIILGLWHKFKHSEHRQKIISRLNRLTKRQEINKDPHHRSHYGISVLEAADSGVLAPAEAETAKSI